VTVETAWGQGLSSSTGANRLNPCTLYLRFQACQWLSGQITLCAMNGPERVQQKLFDDFVGAGKQRWWHSQAKSPGRLKIDEQLDLGGLLDWQSGWLFALEYSASVDTHQTI
jgi:hypothetical protein